MFWKNKSTIVFHLSFLLNFLFNGLWAFDSRSLLQSSSFHHAIESILKSHRSVNHFPVEEFSSISSVSNLFENETSCKNDLLTLERHFHEGKLWALKTVDAWGSKIPWGILDGSHLWLGSYDECQNLLYVVKNRSFIEQPFPTRYCTISKSPDENQTFVMGESSIVVGLCLPESCRSTRFHQNLIDLHCPDEFRSASMSFFLTISLIIVLSIFVIGSTFFKSLEDFSLISTMRKIFDDTLIHSNLKFFGGIRSLSLIWIILGHSYVFQLTIADNLVTIVRNYQRSILNQILFGAVFAVDNFFFLSGFFSVFVIRKKIFNNEQFRITKILSYYLHRYVRLIPTLLFVLLISLNLSSRLGSGPLFPTSTGFETKDCRKQWWSNFIFINNLFKPETSCLPVTWYLANDFQFHLLAPMLLLPLIFNKRRLSYILIGLVLLGNILTRLTIILKNPGFENGFVENDSLVMNFFNRVYITPWCRIGPFLIGMLTKLFLDQCEGRFSRLNTVFFSSMSIFSAIFCIFFPFYSNEFGRWAKIFYQTSSNVCWSISLAWFIIVCSIHPSMKIKRFLSMSIWLIIARLSYSAYLIHPIVILTEIYNRSTTIHYQASVIFNGFAGQTLLTLFVSLITVILVESPILNVEKRIRNVFRQKTFVHFQRSAYGTIN